MSALAASVKELQANDRQWQAFTTEGHCVVLAPPGSGKTKLLATRVAYDLLNKIPEPHGAACVTLTNAATQELRSRIESLGVSDRPAMFVGTVHSFALARIVIPFASLVGRPELAHMSIASRAEESATFEAALRSVFPAGTDSRYVRSTIEINRKRFATDEDWARHSQEIREVARQYSHNLHSTGKIDFIELVELAVDFVENHPIVRTVLNARYPQIYVDEYQDLAPGLDRLVKALCFDYRTGSELFAVGDPDQAILAFTGTRPELLIELSQRSEVTPVYLEKNYRCGQEIIRVASFMKQGTSPVVGDRVGGHVSITRCPQGFAEQCVQVAQRVREEVELGTPLHEIAIICPTNEQCEKVVDAFRQWAIPSFFRNTDHYRLTLATSFVEGCAAWATLGHERSGYRLGVLLRQWRSILGRLWRWESDPSLAHMLLSCGELAEESAAQLPERLREVGLDAALTRTPLVDDSIEFANMVHALTLGPLRQLTVRELAERALKVNRVEVTTMTASKGLEFDVVHILGMDQKRVPFFTSLNDPRAMQEERRKFYVSLTRARNEVHLYYSGFVEWKNSNAAAGPSMFLRDLGLI